MAKHLLRKASKLPISLLHRSNKQLKTLRLVVTGSCNSSHHQRFMREKFFKNEITEKIPRNSMTSERLGNADLLSVERVRAEKIDLDDFVDEFDSRHDNRRIKLH